MSIERIAGLNANQVDQLHGHYEREWWTRGRTRSQVEGLLAHSDLIFAYADTATGDLAAFARVLTDRTIKALILDVIVDPGRRATGPGRRVMDDVMAAPKLAAVRHFELYCAPDMRDFYRRWGFTDELGDLAFMRADRGG
jgi:GNAT superfamily N-acetyltransferase